MDEVARRRADPAAADSTTRIVGAAEASGVYTVSRAVAMKDDCLPMPPWPKMMSR